MSLLKLSLWGLTTFLFVGCNSSGADGTASDVKDADSDETMAEMAEGGVKDQEFSLTLPPLRDVIPQPVAEVKIFRGDSQIVGDDCRNDLGAGAVVQSKVIKYVAGSQLGPIQLQDGKYTAIFHVTSNGSLKLSGRSVFIVESGKEILVRLYLKRAAWCGPGQVVIQPVEDGGPMKSEDSNGGQSAPSGPPKDQTNQNADPSSGSVKTNSDPAPAPVRPVALSFSVDVDGTTKIQIIQLRVDPKSVSGAIKYKLVSVGSESVRLVDAEKGIVEYQNQASLAALPFQYVVISSGGTSLPATVAINRMPTR